MNQIKFLDMTHTNCWIPYLKPFAEGKRSGDDVENYQRQCIKKNIFGIGWTLAKNESISHGSAYTADLGEKYLQMYRASEPKSALDSYSAMKPGDFAIMRLLDGHYYVGKLATGAIYLYSEEEPYNKLSWGCKVEKWHEIGNETEVPSEIRGRFSQRRHPAIQRISRYRQRLLVQALYQRTSGEESIEIPRIAITENTFARSLDYQELEDLVYLHMVHQEEAKGYVLLPSSCKINQQKYEFRLTCGQGGDITCQVKNQREFDLEQFQNDGHFHAIYVFSGKWSDVEATELRKKYQKAIPNLRIILPSELYRTLMDTEVNKLFQSPYYVYDSNYPSIDEVCDCLHQKGYEIVRDGQTASRSTLKCYADDDYICFDKENGSLFYSAETGMLVKSWRISKRQEDQKIWESILHDLNTD